MKKPVDTPIQLGRGHCCLCVTSCWHLGPAQYCAKHRPADVLAHRDERGIVTLTWPKGRGPVLIAPELLEDLVRQLNESR